MTVVVGYRDGADLWIGADSMSHAGCQAVADGSSTGPKVFQWGHLLVGQAGPARLGQLLMYAPPPPEQPEHESGWTYCIRRLAPHLLSIIGSAANTVRLNSSDDAWDLLIGTRDGLYNVSYDLCVEELGSYGAIGCGRAVALGALYALDGLDLSPRSRIARALSAAEAHDIHVGKPFIITRRE